MGKLWLWDQMHESKSNGFKVWNPQLLSWIWLQCAPWNHCCGFCGEGGNLGDAVSLPQRSSCDPALLCPLLSKDLTCSLPSGGEGWVQNQMGGWTGAFVISLTIHRPNKEVAMLEKRRASKPPQRGVWGPERAHPWMLMPWVQIRLCH